MDKNFSNLSSEYNKSDFNPELVPDDSEFNDINFKAITDGLGFHNSDEKVSTKTFEKNIKNPIKKKAHSVPTQTHLQKQVITKNETVNYMGGLEAFYTGKAEKEKRVEKKVLKVKKKIVLANRVERSLAYIADFAIIVAFVFLTFGTLLVVSGVNVNLIEKLLTTQELITYSSTIFILNYLLYFTVLDVKASPGKMLFGIKLIKNKKSSASATLAFLRALISLPVIFMLLNIHDSICSSKVIKVNED